MEYFSEVVAILLEPLIFLWPALVVISYVFVVVTVWRIWKKVRHLPG